MTFRTLLLIAIIFASLLAGMVYYTWLAQQEQQPADQVQLQATSKQPTLDLVPGQQLTEKFHWPVPGSAPTEQIRHTIPLEDIRRGCFAQDCIPSVDVPKFVPARDLSNVLAPQSLGIFIASAQRFYPFPMLETREIVNDVLPNGEPIAVTYCPLCGTGIVFSRTLSDGVVREFGVSGMLWQSNLLMYDRADTDDEKNLWSQVLGQAVAGNRAGESLAVVPSDIITFADWLAQNPTGQTLTTGLPRDPYNGDYFGTAQFFQPDFDAATSKLAPMTRVHGIIVNGQAKAYVSDQLFNDYSDLVGGERVFVEKDEQTVRFIISNAEQGEAPTVVPDVEGFWFSWAAAHPETELWVGDQ